MLAGKSQAWSSDPRRVGLEDGVSLASRLSVERLGVLSLSHGDSLREFTVTAVQCEEALTLGVQTGTTPPLPHPQTGVAASHALP